MTEAQWESCSGPGPMLEFLRQSGQPSDRRLLLFGSACQRRILHLLHSETARKVVEALELYADGMIERTQLPEFVRDSKGFAIATDCWRDAALSSARLGLLKAPDEQRFQAALLRDIFGPLPFRQVRIDPAWLSWNGGAVRELAEAAYAEHSLPAGTLDSHRLAVLADALEEAGCDNEEILFHCRQQERVHVRGCWVVDLILGK